MKKFEHTASSEQLALIHRRLIKEYGELYDRIRDERRARLEKSTHWYEKLRALKDNFMEHTKKNPMDTATAQGILDQFIEALNELDQIDKTYGRLIAELTAQAGALQAEKASLDSQMALLESRLESPSGKLRESNQVAAE